MQEFLITLGKTVVIQIIGLFGIFFVFGIILSILQKKTHQIYMQTIGWKGILWTAWIGTPIHEFGHAFFAKLFRHKIVEISVFKPNEETGELGHVEHTFKKFSLYQRIGNFFIGSAPMIFGSIFLVLMLYFLLPNGKEIFQPLQNNTSSIFIIFTSVAKTLWNLFSIENITAWNFWLFLYMSFAIASHIAPSKKDRQGMWGGLFWLILILIIINAIALYLETDITKYILAINQYLGIFIAVFTYALIISIIHYILASIILKPFRK
jgi:hypothetical protein